MISGTPATSGVETFTITATDSLGATTTENYSITVNPPISLGPATLPAGTAAAAYDQTITASGGTGTVTLAVTNLQGAISGLTVPASGDGSLVISGTPATRRGGNVHHYGHRFAGCDNDRELQHYRQSADQPGTGDAAGGHGGGGLRPDDHGQWRHRHGHAGGDQPARGNQRTNCSGQRRRAVW